MVKDEESSFELHMPTEGQQTARELLQPEKHADGQQYKHAKSVEKE